MKNAIILIVIIALIVVGYLVFKNKGDESELPTDNETATTTPVAEPARVNVTLNEVAKSGESGAAVLENVDGKLKITITVSDTPAGVAQPAFVYAGSCAKLGEAKYTLADVVGGTSETVLDTETVEQFLTGLPLAISIQKSEKDVKKSIACGDISNPTVTETVSTTATTTSATTTTSTTTKGVTTTP